jgi:hypothetical protein
MTTTTGSVAIRGAIGLVAKRILNASKLTRIPTIIVTPSNLLHGRQKQLVSIPIATLTGAVWNPTKEPAP